VFKEYHSPLFIPMPCSRIVGLDIILPAARASDPHSATPPASTPEVVSTPAAAEGNTVDTAAGS
jgi:hypothetical protein